MGSGSSELTPPACVLDDAFGNFDVAIWRDSSRCAAPSLTWWTYRNSGVIPVSGLTTTQKFGHLCIGWGLRQVDNRARIVRVGEVDCFGHFLNDWRRRCARGHRDCICASCAECLSGHRRVDVFDRRGSGSSGTSVGTCVLFGLGISPCLLYTSPSPRDQRGSRMPSSA